MASAWSSEIGRLKKIAFWIVAPAFIAFVCPNTLQILSRYEPALGWKPSPQSGATARNPRPMGTVAGVGRRDVDDRGYRDS